MDVLHTLTWYEQENLGHKTHFEAFPRTRWFLCLLSSKDGSQRRCTSVLRTSICIRKPPNLALFQYT